MADKIASVMKQMTVTSRVVFHPSVRICSGARILPNVRMRNNKIKLMILCICFSFGYETGAGVTHLPFWFTGSKNQEASFLLCVCVFQLECNC